MLSDSNPAVIREEAFYQCAALQSVALPAGLTTLEDYAFAETGLKSVFIPGGVTNVGAGAFKNCTALRTVNIVNGRSRYTPDYGSAATVNVAFTAAPQIVANVVDDDLNTDGLWALTDGYTPPHTLTNGSPVTLPDESGIGDVRNDLPLTLTVPEGYGFDGTIFNGGDEIPVCEGKTVYGFAPQGVVTLNLHFYKKRIT